MEALVIILLEYLALLLWPVLAMCIAAISAMAEMLFELIRMLFMQKAARRSRSATPKPNAQTDQQRARARKALSRRLTGLVGVPVAIVAFPVIIANLFFFEPLARLATDRIASETGMKITYDKIDGDIFTGRLAITGLTVRKPAQTGQDFDFAVETAMVDVNIWTIFSHERKVEALSIAGVTGNIALNDAPQQEDGAKASLEKKRSFAVSNLRIADVKVDILPVDILLGDRPPVRLEIAQATSPLFRSRYAAFDLFFRSNLTAQIDDTPLLVQTEALSDQSRRTTWRLENAPVNILGDLVNRAPATWFQDGTVSVEVDDFWDLDDLTIDMDWRLYLDNAKIAAPQGAGLRERALAGALDKFVNFRRDRVELAFQLYLDEETFSVSGSRDLTALWNAFLPAIQDMLESKGIKIGEAEQTPAAAEQAESDAPTLGDRIRSVTDRIGNPF